MNTLNSNRYSASPLKKMMILCVGSTVLAALALLVSAVLSGSPTGGPDGPFIITFLLLLIFLYVILPMHVFGGLATTYKYFSTGNRKRFVFPLSYFVLWFLALFLYFVFSGAAEPVFEEINARNFRDQHAAEMALLASLRQNKGHVEVPSLIEQVKDINLPDPEFGMTALQWAARGASAEIIELLINAGADPNVRYHRDWSDGRGTLKNATVLDIAAWSNVEPKEKTLLLIQTGVMPTAQALVGVCERGDIGLLREFRERGVDLQTATEGEGLSCFHVAAKNGDLGLIETLFSMGVTPNLITKYKLTPLDLAMAREQRTAAIALLKGSASANQPRRLIDLVVQMPREDFDLAASYRPLSDLRPADARAALGNAVAACEVSTVRRLFTAGLTLGDEYREVVEVPEHCEFRELLLQIIRPVGTK